MMRRQPWNRRALTAAMPVIMLTVLLLLRAETLDSAADSVSLTVPAAVGFAVTNVGVSTAGSPSATPVTFSSLSVSGSRVLRISVKADGNFVPPGGQAIPAAKVSWTTSGVINGIGSAGVLSTSAYGQLYQSSNGKKVGGVNVSWTLAAPGTPLRAGVHALTIRWKFEAIIP
jgi:hypothetical protein